MAYMGLIISLIFIVIVSRLLLKKYHPQAVLLLAGLLMIIVAGLINMALPELNKPTGFAGFDLFALLKESFAGTNATVGLMIMVIGGFVALGVIVASILFGFQLGILFSGLMVVFASVAILYTTSAVMRDYRTDQYVAASLSLFAAVALLFWYILRIFMGRR